MILPLAAVKAADSNDFTVKEGCNMCIDLSER